MEGRVKEQMITRTLTTYILRKPTTIIMIDL
jgi:hypothetical protein